ncbi:uncharacterized protein LOC111674306 isoform X2 [Orussus abietinus]|uniref:uncharacterized protein LOC111674306 isoform X2 n=1 Tax=Orussus abietinus TaxID=222816 RepID=UPI000C715FE8|nr:uncharacterized protein LOC111674306 isoform X2 [Orussus abietinus]
MYLSKLTCCFIALLVIHLAEAGFYSRSHSKENGQSQWGKPQVGTANIANATKNQKSTQRADTGKFDAKNGSKGVTI